MISDISKICAKCKEEKALQEFNKSNQTSDGLSRHCKFCIKTYFKEYYKKNKRKIDKKNLNWAKENKDKMSEFGKRHFKKNFNKIKSKRIKYRYNITIEEYSKMLEEQDYQCKICKEIKALCIDHDHKTGKVRGLLCGKCNRGIGFFNDNIKSLHNAIDYLTDNERNK